MVVLRVALLASVFAFAACDVGEVPIGGGGGPMVDGGGGTDPQASAMYTAMVVPLVGTAGRNCTQAACHGGVQPPLLNSFETLTNNGALPTYARKPSAMNKLVTGPLTIDGTGKHPTGNPLAVPYLDTTQKATVSMWIDQYGL
jgi:hypothetical protein